jgi:hypothetical protein
MPERYLRGSMKMSSGIGVGFILGSKVGKALATETLDKNHDSALDSKAIKLTIYVTFIKFKLLVLVGTDRSAKLRCCSQIDVTCLSISFPKDIPYLEVCGVVTCHGGHHGYLLL